MAQPPSSPRGDLLRTLVFLPLGLCLLYLAAWIRRCRKAEPV